ncbi:MAG: polysaccharide biosynthesis tyrosine autokinase [Leptolyngbya sp. SIO3F4]|nr:polysaccharide biosynthesis tyrosine autokinase [Leptolyngbya sp. SIO3F4]
MNHASINTPNEPEFGYGQLLGILMRRFVWVGGAVAGAVGLSVTSTLREDPVYESSMQLLVEPNYRETVDITKQNVDFSSESQTDYATQLNLMRSEAFLKETVERMLVNNPQFCGKADLEPHCVKKFQSKLQLSQVVEDKTATRIFEARFKGDDPFITQAFLETLGEVYLDYNKDQQKQRLEKGLTLVNQQIEEVTKNLAISRQRLQQFRETQNLINPEQEALAVASSLRQVEQAKTEVDNQLYEVEAQYNALQDQLSADPQTALISSRLSQSSRYQRLLNTLQETEIALDRRLALYTEADPGVQDLISQREGQIQRLQGEIQRVFGDIPAQIDLSETALLTEGQLGGIDLELVSNLVDAEVNLKSLDARQIGLSQATAQLQAKLNAFPDLIAEYDRIQPEVGIQEEALTKLLQLRQELSNEIAQGGFSWDVVESPQAGRKISPQPTQSILLGIVAGCFVGGALAFGREAMDKSVRTSDQLKKQSIFPLLGIIPEIPKKTWDALPIVDGAAQFPTQAFSLSQYQPFRDSLDLIYKTIQLKHPQPLTSLMVTSALAEEGKTTLSVGLALSAARSHQRVLLIDANLRRPSLHQFFGISNETGLSTQLPQNPFQLDQVEISPVPVSLAGANIDVLPAGPVPEDPMMFLSSLQMRYFLEKAEVSYDLVIVDAPAILGLADGLQLASMCKASVMVSRIDRTTQADLTQAVTILSQINTIGIVANGHHDSNHLDAPYASSRGVENTKEPSMLWQKARTIVGVGALSIPLLHAYADIPVKETAKKFFPNDVSTEVLHQVSPKPAESEKPSTIEVDPSNLSPPSHDNLQMEAIPSADLLGISAPMPRWSTNLS